MDCNDLNRLKVVLAEKGGNRETAETPHASTARSFSSNLDMARC